MNKQFVCGSLLAKDKLFIHFHRAYAPHAINCRQNCEEFFYLALICFNSISIGKEILEVPEPSLRHLFDCI